MLSMYGCRCDEELQDTQKYLREHGDYQLEHVSSNIRIGQLVALSHHLVTLLVFMFIVWSLKWSLGIAKATGRFLLFSMYLPSHFVC